MAFYKGVDMAYNISDEKPNPSMGSHRQNTKDEDVGRRKQGRRSNGMGGVILRGNTYYARWTDANGERHDVSTHTSDKDEAMRILATYTTPIRESKSQEEIKLRLQQSIDVLELRKDVKKIGRVKLDDLVEKFLNHRELADAKSNTKDAYKYQLMKLVATIKEKYPSVKHIDELTFGIVDDVMGELAKHYTPMVYNLALATYRKCWRLFSRSTNHFLKVAKRKVDKSRHRITITEDDVRRIFASCRNDVERAVWGVGVYTGLRCVDVCHLTYGALSKGLTSITWTPIKTRRHMSSPLTIPICPTLKNLLVKVLDLNKVGNKDEKDTPLWATYKRRHETRYIPKYFAMTLKKAGLPTYHIDESGHRQMDTGFHITRLAFVSFASKHLSPLLVSKIVGHSSLKMTEHYCQTNQEVLMEGISQIPDFTCEKGEVETPTSKEKDEMDEVMEILNELKDDGESALDCLKRIVSMSKEWKKAS